MKNKIFIVEQFGNLDMEFISEYYNLLFSTPSVEKITTPMGDVEGYGVYGDPLMELILKRTTSFMMEVYEKQLMPTYSYVRHYTPGALLSKHKDRPSCEYSVSFAISGESNSLWACSEEDESDKVEIQLTQGNAFIYPGCEIYHWRDKIETPFTQAFLHWVDIDGPNASWIMDRRPGLGHPYIA